MKNVKIRLFLLVVGLHQACKMPQIQAPMQELYKSDAFSVYPDSVVQGKHKAVALSATHLQSTYVSPASATFPRLVSFKFSINEKDNELPVGQDHWVLIEDEAVSPVIMFGEKPSAMPPKPTTFLPTNYTYTFRVNVSGVLKQFKDKGYYEAFDGSRVSEADFKGFYIAGGAEPLSWDFVNLENKGLKLKQGKQDGIYEITVKLNPHEEKSNTLQTWKPVKDLSQRPRYQSNQPIVDALFNLSLEEAILNIESDSTFRTGAKWSGVWTRDISYSILLAFAYHEPEVAKISLRKKVSRNRVIQDTGSGGAWPVSSDRTTWVLAAWEIYKATGDLAWLDEVYPIIKNTLEDDFKTVYNAETGMYSGESSFLDWREQTYPKWMNNADIYVSQNLGTNVVHYQAHQILAAMAKIKGEPAEVYEKRAAQIKQGINEQLWVQEKGWYAQYLYGRGYSSPSIRFEALGEALAVLFDVADADRAKSILDNAPLTTFGTTCIYPQIPGIPPYHNNAIWPFVQAYWNMAAAKGGNEAVLNHGLASIYRAGAMFLTNYENMVAETGDFLGTEINSDRMLWSMAGNLAMVHRVFMGMHFEPNGLYFKPVIPAAYGGTKTLSNFRYRNAVLQITVEGHGNTIQEVQIDGKIADKAFIPGTLSGQHRILIKMNNMPMTSAAKANLVANHFTLSAPVPRVDTTSIEQPMIVWDSILGAKQYRVYRNGSLFKTIRVTNCSVTSKEYVEWSVSAVDSLGYESFMSEPMTVHSKPLLVQFENSISASDLPYTNFSGKGFIEISTIKNTRFELAIEVEQGGEYLLDVRYSNGNGPWNTDNKCAIRSLRVNQQYAGVLVFPQRGKEEWSDWGFSNARKIKLQAGKNMLQLAFDDWNNNMNIQENKAMLDYVRLVKL